MKLFLAYLVDLVVGDPSFPPHPVVLIGKGISCAERRLRPYCTTSRREKGAGIVLLLFIVGSTYLLTYGVIRLAYFVHFAFGDLLAVWLLSTTLANKGLQQAALSVYRPLIAGDLEGARRAVSMIVGRDTERLDASGVTRATVETVAENLSDGIVAPLFYACIGGAPLAMAYKAVNTLDSMVGHKDERYLHFGWASARFDDLANFLPARITGLLLLAAGIILRGNVREGWRAMREDTGNHPSPNGGVPEGAMAGLLGVQLGGLNYYKGVPSFRGYLGRPNEPLSPAHIRKAARFAGVTAFLAVVLGCGILMLFE